MLAVSYKEMVPDMKLVIDSFVVLALKGRKTANAEEDCLAFCQAIQSDSALAEVMITAESPAPGLVTIHFAHKGKLHKVTLTHDEIRAAARE